MEFAVIVLAAGQGTRMKSDLPKVLHKIAGAPMLMHALRSTTALAPSRTIVVAGHGAEAVEAALEDHGVEAEIVLQDEQRGTADAAARARPALEGFAGDAVVIFGDTPFIQQATFAKIAEARAKADVVVLGFEAAEPGGYGRLVTEGDALKEIVEAKDCTPEQLKITLCNSGIVAAKADVLFDLIDAVEPNNAQGEYYLTSIVGIAAARGMTATVVTCGEDETLGVNSRVHLAEAEAAFQARARREAMENGVTLTDPASVHFAFDTVIGRDVEIGPYTVFGPGASVETGAKIVGFSHIEGAHIGGGATVGPYARLRPGTELANETRVGNFVEIKAATIAEGAKVNHLTYIGDATIGARANIGAGTITCNYDGVFKHQTVIGADAFIGSNSALVAPVTVGDGALVATGTVVTKNSGEGDLVLSRGAQTNKPGMGARLMSRLRSLKAAGKRP